ncbi:MAG: hypothetical protein LBR08_06740 [Bacteroidales bacterium]|nr:hypothetical protein [Bacteroidales bacterium]
MKRYCIAAACLLLRLPAAAQSPEMYAPVPEWYLDYDVKFYRIDIEADNTATDVTGHAEITAEVIGEALQTFTLELSRDIRVDSVLVDDRKVEFRRENDLLHAIHPLQKGNTYRTSVYYAAENIKGEGFFSAVSNKTDEWNIPVTWTLSEPYNAKNWFPCKQYLPDKADSAHIFITVPSHLKAGAPGVLSAVKPAPDNKLRYEWKTRYPIAYYLLSFAVSDYREYVTHAHPKGVDHPVKIQNYIYNNDEFFRRNKALMDTTASLIELFSELYLPYPFSDEKYGHCIAPMGGGMEHQTMTTLSGFGYLLVAHELAHQWFGNMVSCASFQDVWINEGFASYSEYLTLERFAPHQKAVEWMRDAHAMASWARDESIFVPKESVADVWRVFSSSLSYKKGAALVHYIRYVIGDDRKFFDVLRGFLKKYAFSTATGMDFKKFAEEQTGIDLTLVFNQWYFGKGFPVFDISWRQTGQKVELLAEHAGSSSATPLFVTDMDVRLVKTDGSDTLIRIPIRTGSDTFMFDLPDAVADLVIDPEYCVPKEIRSKDRVRDFPTADRFVLCDTHIARKQNLTVGFTETPSRKCTLQLTDAGGTNMLPETPASRRRSITLPTAALPAGTYLLYVINGKERFVRKIVKM